MAYAMVNTASPNANEIPRRPMPRSGSVPESTALPQPPSTNQNVPNDSAAKRLVMTSFLGIVENATVARAGAAEPDLLSTATDLHDRDGDDQ
jgi:hypothetical protein